MTVLSPRQFAIEFGLLPSAGAPPSLPPQFVPYVTGTADRWDTIAWLMYGDPTNITPIIDANPGVPVSPVLASGTTVYVPVIQPPPAPVNSLPWAP